MRSTYKKVSGMTAEIKVRRCYGCGSTLQNADRYEPGYVSAQRQESDEGLCDRCYKLRNPGAQTSQVITRSFTAMIRKAIESQALLCYVIDAFSLDSSVVTNLSELIRTGRVLALVNKVDLLPANISNEELLEGVKSRLSAQGISPLAIYLTSINDEQTIRALRSELDAHRDGKDVYLIGTQRVGKSAIINEFLKYYDNSTDRTVTRESLGEPGDDLVVTAIPLDEDSTLYDTPGVFEPTSIVNQIDRRTLKYVLPRTRVVGRNFTVKPGEGLVFGALSYCLLTSAAKTDVEAYFSSDVQIDRIRAERAQETFTSLCQDGKGHPASPTIRDTDALAETVLEVPDDGQEYILSITGFGRLRLKGAGQTFAFYAPKGVRVLLHR